MRAKSPRPGSRRATERAVRRTSAAFLLLACAAAAPSLAGWWDDAADARPTSLAELRRAPDRWRDVPVLLDVRFGGAGERLNPYFTQFTPQRWQPVTLSPRSAAGDADIEITTAFVRRGGRDDLRLGRISPNQPVLVRAAVRDTVAGKPWIEILGFTLDGDPLTPEEQTLVREADRFLAGRNPRAAERLYRRVIDGRTLATRDRADLLRRVGVALHDRRLPREALATFREALALDPDDLDARYRAERLEASLARVPLAPPQDGAAPTAARAAASTPQRPAPADVPLLLPGHGPALSPPSGLPAPTNQTPPATRGNADSAAAPQKATPRPAPRPPVPVKTDAGDDSNEIPDEDAPPPVPPRPKLSGPR